MLPIIPSIVQGNNQMLGSPVNRIKLTGLAASRALADAPLLLLLPHHPHPLPSLPPSSSSLARSLLRSPAHALAAPLASYTAPFAARCAPLLTRADGLANAGLDAVESRYPYPFRTPPQDIIADIRGSADHARAVAAKTVDDRLKSPAVAVAQGIDQV